ncbi:MAG TPA: response regulator [Solirubrobacterales bacterium]|nr:response regulator [Solirubrobacterales bacterium]
MKAGASQDGRRPTVLVADDDADIRHLLSQRLGHRGYRVITAENGDHALDMALDSPPDAAILDGIMPGMEGHQVCAAMRANPSTSLIPIVLLTAKAGDADEREAVQSGADAYMAKPFRIEELDSKLRDLLTSAQSREP